jgi:hypothetical protein
LYLCCCCEVSQNETGSKIYYAYTEPSVPEAVSTEPLIVHKPELIPRFWEEAELGGFSVKDNLADIDEDCQKIITNYRKQFEVEQGQVVRYAGLFPFVLDGAIRQVTWSIGNGPSTTTVARNTEMGYPSASLKEKKLRRWVDRQLIKSDIADKKAEQKRKRERARAKQ